MSRLGDQPGASAGCRLFVSLALAELGVPRSQRTPITFGGMTRDSPARPLKSPVSSSGQHFGTDCRTASVVHNASQPWRDNPGACQVARRPTPTPAKGPARLSPNLPTEWSIRLY